MELSHPARRELAARAARGRRKTIPLKASDVHSFLRSLDGGWVDWSTTVDRFYAGDTETEITGIAVGWMSYWRALREAGELGCNLFVTHEPTYFSAHDDEERIFRFEGAQAKRRWIEESGMVVLRCHDVWDQLPRVGIPDAWGAHLGLGDPIAGSGYVRVYDVSGRTARDVARQVAQRCWKFGQEAFQLIGPADAPVSRVAIGTGAITPFTRFLDEFTVDLAICSDDGFTYWHGGALVVDLGVPVIVVNHAVTELPGIRLLAETLARRFPEVPVHHIEQSCLFELAGPTGAE